MNKYIYIVITVLFYLTSCTVDLTITPNNPIEKTNINALKTKALTTLQLALNDKDPYIRNHAIEIAVSTRQKQFMSEILKKLNDESVPVRFAAAIAIGEMECLTCQDYLNQAINDKNLNVQIAGAYSLVRLGDAAYLTKIRDAVSNKDDTIKANALLLLGKLNNNEDIALMYNMTKNIEVSDKVRLQATDSLARMKDIRVYRSKLWPLLISKYYDDKVMGIRGMGLLGTTEAKSAIQTMLQQDEVLEVRLCAAEELAKLGYKDGLQQIIDYFKTNPDFNKPDQALSFAISSIGWMKESQLYPYLSKALDSDSAYIRILAAQSIFLITK